MGTSDLFDGSVEMKSDRNDIVNENVQELFEPEVLKVDARKGRHVPLVKRRPQKPNQEHGAVYVYA